MDGFILGIAPPSHPLIPRSMAHLSRENQLHLYGLFHGRDSSVFFCILRICHWNQAHQCTIYIHLPPFTSNPLTSTDQGPDGTPNIPKPKLQREAAIGFHLVTINMYKQPLHISFSLRLTSDLVAPGISGMVSTCHNVQDRLHGTTS